VHKIIERYSIDALLLERQSGESGEV